MPRPPRFCPDNVPQHVINRGDQKERVFRSPADYLGFVAAMADAAERTVVRLLAFSLMPNHFHLVLWPVPGGELSTYMQLLMNAHLRDIVPRHGTSGLGHVYQGRFRNFEILNEQHFLNVCRYVEANALQAGLVSRAEDWPWCSLSCCGPVPDINLLSEWPVLRPCDWLEQVNRRRLPAPLSPGWLAPEVAGTPAQARHGRRGRTSDVWQPQESATKPPFPNSESAESRNFHFLDIV
jgi:Transposase and inactivated derivatives